MNFRKLTASALIIAGAWLLLWSMGSRFDLSRSAQAQELPPRPTLTPVAPAEEPRREPRPGRIVGTVIDLTTGAPAAGVTVRINSDALTTDANGNYGRENLTPGTYVVDLIIPPERGTPAQGAITITLPEGETARQDLAFYGPPPASMPSAETAPMPPAALPVTGASDDAAWLAALGALLLAGGGFLLRRAT
ncbi:carboxypeptidase-like regulatory domain-containing protein [Roseiflexus castenholzii]|uniref:carboxypeptidase-like regulatory domain-containing protein n=1 Tax=Roseiflexus castenholzii TaxID=120962 RepID=UPI003C7C16BF